MAGQTAAVNGGSGKTSTPANNVDGASANRRVRPPFPLSSPCPLDLSFLMLFDGHVH